MTELITDDMVEAAYDAFTRSFRSKPIGVNNTRDDLRAALTGALIAERALKEKIERLRDALEPFAKAHDHFDSYVRDDDTVPNALRNIRAHHIRRAARALSSIGETR